MTSSPGSKEQATSAVAPPNIPVGDIRSPARRLPSGVPNLDLVLGGGLPRGALILVTGVPGSGKTTLSSQMVFTAARDGKNVLILSALSESSSKLIEHLAGFRFFDRNLIGGVVRFLALERILSEGLAACATTIFAEARKTRADYVLLDGFRGMPGVEADPPAARTFLYDVGTTLNTIGVTTLVTSETDPHDPRIFPETTTADVILGLHYALLGARQYRGIEVIKARGAAQLPGMHAVVLDAGGITVYPQLEERLLAESPVFAPPKAKARVSGVGAASVGRASFGSTELDAMLRGGIPQGTCTVLAGSLGTGKTLLSINYALAGVRAGEPVVFLSFRESMDQIRQVGRPFAFADDLSRALDPGGGLTFLETPPIKLDADVLADRLLAEVDRHRARRVIVDSVAELERAVLHGADPQRLEDYLAALLQAFRRRNVTALLLKETDKVVAASLELSADALSVLAENVLLLQHIPYHSRLYRIISVPKLRFSDHDTAIREFRIQAPEGLRVLAAVDSDEGVLSGITGGLEWQAMVLSGQTAHGERTGDHGTSQ